MGVYFNNILCAAFTPADPKIAKKSVKSSSFLRFQGFAGVKAASKHVDEIDPGPGYVLHTFSSSNQDWISNNAKCQVTTRKNGFYIGKNDEKRPKI